MLFKYDPISFKVNIMKFTRQDAVKERIFNLIEFVWNEFVDSDNQFIISKYDCEFLANSIRVFVKYSWNDELRTVRLTEFPEKFFVFRGINVVASNSFRSVHTCFDASIRASFLRSLQEFAKLNRREIRSLRISPNRLNEADGEFEQRWSSIESMSEITVACFREYKLDLRTCRIGSPGTRHL